MKNKEGGDVHLNDLLLVIFLIIVCYKRHSGEIAIIEYIKGYDNIDSKYRWINLMNSFLSLAIKVGGKMVAISSTLLNPILFELKKNKYLRSKNFGSNLNAFFKYFAFHIIPFFDQNFAKTGSKHYCYWFISFRLVWSI